MTNKQSTAWDTYIVALRSLRNVESDLKSSIMKFTYGDHSQKGRIDALSARQNELAVEVEQLRAAYDAQMHDEGVDYEVHSIG